MLRLINFIFGYVTVSVPTEQSATLWNLLADAKILSWDSHVTDTGVEIKILLKDTRYFKAASETYGISYQLSDVSGLPAYAKRYRERYGLFAGLLVFIVLQVFASRFVWRVDVEGNERLTDREILQIVADCGVRPGTRLSDIVSQTVSTRVMQACPEISWMSVHTNGTVATVEVLERKVGSPKESTGASNIVSGYDALVTEVSVRHGYAYVQEGDTVREGQMLVGGVYDTAKSIVSRRADASVIGKVGTNLSFTVPKEIVTRRQSGAKLEKISLIFFGKNINIMNGGRNISPVYDTIVREEVLGSSIGLELPVVIRKEYRVISEDVPVCLTEEEQIRKATAEMQLELTKLLQDGELLCRTTTGHFTSDGGYTLECMIDRLIDIGISVPIQE